MALQDSALQTTPAHPLSTPTLPFAHIIMFLAPCPLVFWLRMRADRAERERRKRETQQELHTEWQRQANLTSLKKATAL